MSEKDKKHFKVIGIVLILVFAYVCFAYWQWTGRFLWTEIIY